jgi:HEAT repeat protein
MKIAFDLDGTLDRPVLRDLALTLLQAGQEVHIISGLFLEAGDWQDEQAKCEKLVRLGLAQPGAAVGKYLLPENLHLTILEAVSHEKFDRAYRLADLGLRKGAYIEKHGIEIMFDDSEGYIEMMPKMCAAQMLRVI